MARMHSARNIALNSICVTIPMFLLTITLIVLVISRSVGPDVHVNQDDAFYVYTNATLLIFVASWMSSLAPLLAGSLINLATYPVAGTLLTDSTKKDQTRLLTPFQLQLVLKIIHDSTWSGLWGWIRYKLGWRNCSAQHGVALTSLSLVASASMLLGLCVFAADTWLHVATTSVDVSQTYGVRPAEDLYSVKLRPECLETNNTFSALNSSRISCTLIPNNSSFMPTVYDATSALSVLNGISSQFSIANDGPDPRMHYLSVAASQSSGGQVEYTTDYTAKTYAVSTTCKPMSRACNMVIDGNVTFNCNNGAFADPSIGLLESGLLSQCFRNADMSDKTDRHKYRGVDNPFYIAGASLDTADDGMLSAAIKEDPEAIIYDVTLATVHLCTVTIYDVEYDLKQGKFMRFTSTPSNASVTNAFMAPYCATLFGSQNTQFALNLATQLAIDLPDWTNRLAAAISSNVMAAGVGAMNLGPALAVQRHIIVTRVPKAPFYLLISLDLIFVALGVLLSVMATLSSSDARKVRFRLTITGIVAAMFGGTRARGEAKAVEDLYDEYHGQELATRIGIDRTSVGGFMLASMSESKESVDQNAGFTFHGMTVQDERQRFPSLYMSPDSEDASANFHPADLEAWNRSHNRI